jgi:hypothetical protein
VHVEITRMITGWLGHTEFGVNKLLGSVPRSKLGSGVDEKPATVKIYNDVDFDIVSAAGVDPPQVPSLVVVSDVDPKGADIGQQKKPAHTYSCVVGVGYYAEETERDRTVRDGNYVMRAVMQSLMRYHESPERSKAYREINGIRLTLMTGLTVQRVAGAVPPSRLLGLVFADFGVLDKLP